MGINSRRVLLISVAVVFLLVVAGCGSNTGGGNTPPGRSNTPLGSGNTPPPPTNPPTFPVTLQLDAASYQIGDTIRVTIKNQSGQMIYFADHRTNCTVLFLERNVSNTWVPIAPCKLMIATRIHSLKAGEISVVQLTSSSLWSVGTYRARLDFSVITNMGGTLKPVYSSNFQLG